MASRNLQEPSSRKPVWTGLARRADLPHSAPIVFLAALVVGAALTLISCAANPRLERLTPPEAPPGGRVLDEPPWVMHELDNPGLRLPNGLEAADADGDGRLDLLTNYEWSGALRVAFGPPPSEVRAPWPAVTVGRLPNAESSCFGDVDGDGDPDIVAARGAEALGRSGVAVLLNPGGARARDPKAWGKARWLTAARGMGHWHYVRCRDLDGDGRLEIVVGGRGRAGPGLRLLAPPGEQARRADFGRWTLGTIDAELESGHGFAFGDLDGDDDEDLVLANSDWNTEPSAQRVAWYENPGGFAALRGPWRRHVVHQAPEFYTKEQVDVGDADRDGRLDFAVHLAHAVYWFRSAGGGPERRSGKERDSIGVDCNRRPEEQEAPRFVRCVIPKPTEARWRSRLLRLADLDGDGELEILGALIHHRGELPRNKAAVFLMDPDWSRPQEPPPTRVLKWGSGFHGGSHLKGEKWDQAIVADLDGDGDLDVAANCEEFDRRGTVYLAVVWFENPAR